MAARRKRSMGADHPGWLAAGGSTVLRDWSDHQDLLARRGAAAVRVRDQGAPASSQERRTGAFGGGERVAEGHLTGVDAFPDGAVERGLGVDRGSGFAAAEGGFAAFEVEIAHAVGAVVAGEAAFLDERGAGLFRSGSDGGKRIGQQQNRYQAHEGMIQAFPPIVLSGVYRVGS
jgi:hypothetical protein